MIEKIIKKNISLLNPYLVMGYLETKNIKTSIKEAEIITIFLKKNYNYLLKDNNILLNLKGQIKDELYYKVSNHIIYLKNKYL